MNAYMCHTNRISLAFVQQLIANQQDGSALCAGNAAKVGDSAQIRLNIPMMNGSFMSMTDSDGSGGLFMFNGKEYLYTHCLEDATNRIVCSRKPSGTVVALILSQPFTEVLRIRNHGTYASSRAFGSTVRSLRIAVIPNRGIFVQIPSDETTVTNQERSSEQRRMQGLMPIAVFLDTVLFHLDESRRRVTARDIDMLLSGAVDMCDVYDEGLAVPAAEKEHARSIVENIRQFCMMAMPCTRPGSEVAKLPFACEQARAHGPETHRAFLLKEFFPHLESSPSLGSFEDDDTGLTRLGLIRCSGPRGAARPDAFVPFTPQRGPPARRRMVMNALATMFGLIPATEKMDMRGMRVRTPEMEVYAFTRRLLFKHIAHVLYLDVGKKAEDMRKARSAEAVLPRRAVLETNVKSSESGTKASTRSVLFDDAVIAQFYTSANKQLVREAELRRSYPNYLQKKLIIKFQHESGSTPGKRRHHPTCSGFICGADTPSTARVGLDMSPNHCTRLTVDVDPMLVVAMLGLSIGARDSVVVYVNGVPSGWCADAIAMRDTVRRLRRTRAVIRYGSEKMVYRPFMGLGVHVERELRVVGRLGARFQPAVFVRCDGGRLHKPVFDLDALRQWLVASADNKTDFLHLMDLGVIEFMDVDEMNSDAVHMCPSAWDAPPGATHSDIHPALMQGVLPSLIPHAKHNHGVKQTNMCNHFKAVMHSASLQHARRAEATSFTGYNMQQPVTQTCGFRWCEMEKRPHGRNMVVAIGTLEGSNQEDAVTIRKSVIERGSHVACLERTHEVEIGAACESGVFLKRVGDTVGPRCERIPSAPPLRMT